MKSKADVFAKAKNDYKEVFLQLETIDKQRHEVNDRIKSLIPEY